MAERRERQNTDAFEWYVPSENFELQRPNKHEIT